MRSLLLQITAVTAMNLKSLPKRFWLSLSTVIAVALVVVVLLAFLAMQNGFQQTLDSGGAKDVAVILRAGSQSEVASVITQDQVRLIDEAPGVAKGSDGKPLVSAVLYLVVDGINPYSHTQANHTCLLSFFWWSAVSSTQARPRPICRSAASARRVRRCARASRSPPAGCL